MPTQQSGLNTDLGKLVDKRMESYFLKSKKVANTITAPTNPMINDINQTEEIINEQEGISSPFV